MPGQGRLKEVPFTIRDPVLVAPLSTVPARDDPARTQKMKGPLHPRPAVEKGLERQAKTTRRDLQPRSSSNVGGPGAEAGSGSGPAQEFAPVVSLDSDDGAPVSPQRGEHVPIAEMSAGDLLPPLAPLVDRP